MPTNQGFTCEVATAAARTHSPLVAELAAALAHLQRAADCADPAGTTPYYPSLDQLGALALPHERSIRDVLHRVTKPHIH